MEVETELEIVRLTTIKLSDNFPQFYAYPNRICWTDKKVEEFLEYLHECGFDHAITMNERQNIFFRQLYIPKISHNEKEIDNHLLHERVQSDLQNEFALTAFQEINELDLVNRELEDEDILKIIKDLSPLLEIPTNNHLIIEYQTDEPYPKYHFQPDTELANHIYIPKTLEKLLNENMDFLEFENLCFYLQQPFYLTNELLPYYIDDDEVDYYYEQVQMNPWLWAITQEGLSLAYLVEVEILDY